MKTIKYILLTLVISSAIVFQSCEDKLEVLPNSSLLAETAFKTVEDLQSGLNSTYSSFDNSTITFNSIFTDNTKVGIDNGGQQLTLHRLVMNPNSGMPQTLWTSRYRIINRANRVIQAIESGSIPTTGREQEVNHIKAQCYALRAFAHFELFQYFTPDYSSGVSIPYVTFVVTSENLPRNSVSEVISGIDSDLTNAANLLDNSQTNNKFITSDFITALRARMSLFAGDYTNALTYADQLIAKYALANTIQYSQMYLDNDNTEVIFKAARVLGDARIGNIWHFGGGGPFIEMSNSFFNILDSNDIRFSVNLNLSDSDPASNLHLINKYPGTSIEFLADFKVFRVSEMYLIKAEAQLREGLTNDSKTTLKQLRDARFNDDTALATYNDLNSGLDYILNERRLELAYEGHRWLDLKRLNQSLVRDNLDCGNLDNACEIINTDPRFTLPIPAAELNANSNMTQNPGY